jgi:hypothetical protein
MKRSCQWNSIHESKQTLEKTEGAIKQGQSRYTGNIRHRTKAKKNTKKLE